MESAVGIGKTNYAASAARSELEFAPAERRQESLLAPVEKRVLIWMAQRTPGWINPDHLTALGFLAQCMAGLCYLLARGNPVFLLVGVSCLALNWLGDSLDGTLARVRQQQRPRYGFYVDHVIDSIGAFFLMGGLALSGYIQPAVAWGMLIAFLLLSVETYLATYTLGKFQLSHFKFGPTEIRILLAIGNIALLHHSVVKALGMQVRLFDLGGIIAIAGMGLMFVVSTVQHTWKLYHEERVA